MSLTASGSSVLSAFDHAGDILETDRPLGNDHAKLGQMAPQRIDQLCALTNQALVGSECNGTCLMFSTLDRHIMQIRPYSSFGDRSRISCVVLLPLDERLYIDWRQQSDVMTKTLRKRPQKWLVAQASIATMQRGSAERTAPTSLVISHDYTEPPRHDQSRRPESSVWPSQSPECECLSWASSFNSTTMALCWHLTMPGEGGIHPISSISVKGMLLCK